MRAMWCPGVQYCSHAFCTTHQCNILSQTLVRYTVYASSVCRIHVSSEGIHYPRTYIHIHLHPHISTLVKLRFQFRPRCLIWLQKAVPGAILDQRIVTHVSEGVKQYIYSTKCIFSVFLWKTSPSMLFLEPPWDIWSPSNIDQRPRIIQRVSLGNICSSTYCNDLPLKNKHVKA